MRAVNLLPREEPTKSFAATRGVVFGGVAGAALATVVLVSMTMSASGAVGEKKAELDALRAQLAAIPRVPVQDASEDAALATEKSARIGALSAALGGRIAWDRILRQMSLVLPEDVWLTNLAAAAPSTEAPASGTTAPVSGFTLTGSTYSQNGVARFLSRLGVIPDLANVRLQSSQTALVGQRELVQFTILADVRAAGAATGAAGS